MSRKSTSDNLLFAVNERPPLWLILVQGLQHVIVVYGEIILFPVVVGRLSNAPEGHVQFACFAAVIGSAVCTALQALRFGKYGSGYAIFMGSSTAYLACSVEAVKLGGFPLLTTLAILVAPVEALFAYFLRFLRHIVTPAVGGIVLLLIVMSLLPLSVREWVGSPGEPHYASLQNLFTGLVTLAVLLGIALFGNKQLRVWCPMIGMAVGFVVAWFLGLTHFESVSAAPWFGLPSGSWPGFTWDFRYDFVPVIAAMAVVTVINGVQALGNSMAVQEISTRHFRKVNYDRIQGCLYIDSIGNVISGLMGSVPNETYPENISVLKATGVASRWVGICGAVIMGALAFSPKIGSLLIEMPQPVFGGFLMGLAAMMFPAGLSLISTSSLTHHSGLVIGISLCIGMVAESGAFFPNTLPTALKIFTSSSVAAGGLTAIVLSVLFSLVHRPRVSFTIDVSIQNLKELMSILENRVASPKLSPRAMHRLQLACEEVFVHAVEELKSHDAAKRITFKMLEQEHDLFVEIIFAKTVKDMDPSVFELPPKEVTEQNIGLILLRQITSELKHVNISGSTYISFKVPYDP